MVGFGLIRLSFTRILLGSGLIRLGFCVIRALVALHSCYSKACDLLATFLGATREPTMELLGAAGGYWGSLLAAKELAMELLGSLLGATRDHTNGCEGDYQGVEPTRSC